MKLNTTKHSSLVSFLCLMLSAPILCAETQSEQDQKAAMAVREKLKTIIVPKVEFKQTPLKEALTITLKQARELDPEMKEVNFIVADAELADKPITLTLTKVPVEIVLHYLLDISRAAFRVEKNNVVFRPFKVNGKILQP